MLFLPGRLTLLSSVVCFVNTADALPIPDVRSMAEAMREQQDASPSHQVHQPYNFYDGMKGINRLRNEALILKNNRVENFYRWAVLEERRFVQEELKELYKDSGIGYYLEEKDFNHYQETFKQLEALEALRAETKPKTIKSVDVDGDSTDDESTDGESTVTDGGSSDLDQQIEHLQAKLAMFHDAMDYQSARMIKREEYIRKRFGELIEKDGEKRFQAEREDLYKIWRDHAQSFGIDPWQRGGGMGVALELVEEMEKHDKTLNEMLALKLEKDGFDHSANDVEKYRAEAFDDYRKGIKRQGMHLEAAETTQRLDARAIPFIEADEAAENAAVMARRNGIAGPGGKHAKDYNAATYLSEERAKTKQLKDEHRLATEEQWEEDDRILDNFKPKYVDYDYRGNLQGALDTLRSGFKQLGRHQIRYLASSAWYSGAEGTIRATDSGGTNFKHQDSIDPETGKSNELSLEDLENWIRVRGTLPLTHDELWYLRTEKGEARNFKLRELKEMYDKDMEDYTKRTRSWLTSIERWRE